MTMPEDDGGHHPVSAVEQVEHLAEMNARSNETLLSLVEKVREDAFMREKKVDLLEQGQRQTRRLIVMVGAILIAMVIIGVVNAYNIGQARRNAAVTAQTARDAGQTYALLFDCINQQGECGKRNAENSKKTLDEVKLYELTVLYCVRINPQIADPDGEDFLACVKKLYPGGPTLQNRAG